MLYQVNGMSLQTVQEVYIGSLNDMLVCEDLNGPDHSYYTVVLIKDHQLAKQFLEVLVSDTGKPAKCYIDIFTYNEGFGVVFDYVKERPLSDFYMGESFSLMECETICINLIMECISTMLPYPLLYLVLKQGQIHLRSDNSVQFGIPMDLSELDATVGEEECTLLCATILRDLLISKEQEKAVSYELLSKKIKKESYTRFKDLYFDVNMASVSLHKRNPITYIKGVIYRNQKLLFRILLYISLFLFILAIILCACQIFMGDIPFIRIFVNTFERIGTESLRQ
jgi:hypothetical protein